MPVTTEIATIKQSSFFFLFVRGGALRRLSFFKDYRKTWSLLVGIYLYMHKQLQTLKVDIL